jgi:hypothetical protein
MVWKCLLCKPVFKWVENFFQGRLKIADDARLGQPFEIETGATVQRVEEFMQADRRIKIDSVASALGCSHDLACSIMHGLLKFQKVCMQWVARELNYQEKIKRMGLSLQHLSQHANEGEGTLNRMVTGHEL